MKEVLIIGSSSLVGQALLAELDAGGKSYKTLDRSSGFNLFDDYDERYWDEVITGFDEVVYISWIGSPSTAQDSIVEGVDVNLRGVSALSAALARRGYGHLVFLSSAGALYGGGEAEATECTLVQPAGYYGESKLRAEEVIMRAFKGHASLQVSILRISNIIGHRKRLISGFDLLNHLVTCLREGREFVLYGDGEHTRDFIAVEDVASAIISTLSYSGGDTIFNICRGLSYSVNEVMALVEEVMGKPLRVSRQPARGVDIRHIRVSAAKAHRLLAWKANKDLRESITQLISH